MKLRKGFVSNSSSSSFIIAVKGNLKEKIREIVEIHKSHKNIFNINDNIDDIATCLIENAEKVTNWEFFEDEWGWTEEDLIKEYPNLMQKHKYFGWDLYYGCVSDEDASPAELFLVSISIDYEDQNIKIKKEAWY